MTRYRNRATWFLSAIVLVLIFTSCDATPPVAPDFKVQATVSGGYNLVQSSDTSVTANSAIIDSAGGTIIVKKHSLTIIPGTLTEPLRFTMATVPGSIQLDLHAYSVATGEEVTTFSSPLLLMMHYGEVRIKNPGNLRVVWVVDGVIKEVRPSDVDKSNHTVQSNVNHFSKYALAID